MNVQEFLTAGATPSEDALQAFVACIGEINTLAQQFATFADDHGGISPDDVTWGHVGNLNQVVAYMTEATRWIGLTADSYAQPSMFPNGEDAPLFTLPEDEPADPDDQYLNCSRCNRHPAESGLASWLPCDACGAPVCDTCAWKDQRGGWFCSQQCMGEYVPRILP